jgi:hypothetical protein
VNRGDDVNPENPAIKEFRGRYGRGREAFGQNQNVSFVLNTGGAENLTSKKC